MKTVIKIIIALLLVMIVGTFLAYWFVKITLYAMLFMSAGFVVCIIVLAWRLKTLYDRDRADRGDY